MNIHFIAIGGAAMHNLAIAVSQKQGYKVTGSDDEIFDPARTHLEQHGLLPAQMGWHPERITRELDAIILGMHAREDNPELLRARELGLKIYSFPEYLYEQTRDKTRIVVGGSHGKTTTTAMILHVLRLLGIEADYMVGAQIEGFDNMVRLTDTAKVAVFEGDEYLTSALDHHSKFHLYKPDIAILTGIEWDHINVFPTFEQYVGTFRRFVELIEPNGTFVYYDGDENLKTIAEAARADIRLLPYNTPEYTISDGVWEVGGHRLMIFGQHNLQNMTAARLALTQIGVTDEQFFNAISSFHGADNRLEFVAENKDRRAVAYKDFAHAPSKLRATINAVREQYPEKRLVACMELHTFSSLDARFLPQYKDTMAKADVAFVYFNPKVIEHKKLTPLSAEDVRSAFGTDNVRVFTDSNELQTALSALSYDDTALLMMSSGTFDGIDIKNFEQQLIS